MTTTDLVAHDHGAACVCGPVIIPIVTGDGEAFHLTAHRRLDGLPSLPWREDEPVPVRLAPRLVAPTDARHWLVVAILCVAFLLDLATM